MPSEKIITHPASVEYRVGWEKAYRKKVTVAEAAMEAAKSEYDPDNRWMYREPRTQEQLAAVRARTIETFKFPSEQKFTCDDCGLRRLCTLAFDMYNTGGDCLYEK